MTNLEKCHEPNVEGTRHNSTCSIDVLVLSKEGGSFLDVGSKLNAIGEHGIFC